MRTLTVIATLAVAVHAGKSGQATATTTASAATASTSVLSDFTAYEAALGGSTSLQGQRVNAGSSFQVQVLTNATAALVTISGTGGGWYGVGFGSTMSNSDMILAWQQSGAWTISARQASGHDQPRPASSISSSYTLVSALSSTSQVTFLRPLSSSGKSGAIERASTSMIWAYGGSAPGSSDPTSNVQEHSKYGTIHVDLSSPVNGTSILTTVDSQAWTTYDTVMVAHAIAACVAWQILGPLAVLVGRFLRHNTSWLRYHKLIQVCSTVPLTIVAVILGASAIQINKAPHLRSTHTVVGGVILVALLVQVALGYYDHHKFDAQRTHRPARNVLHIVLGVSLLVGASVQILLGLALYSHTRTIPTAAWIVVIVFLLPFPLAYVFGLVKLVRQRQAEGMPFSRAAFGLGRPYRSTSSTHEELQTWIKPADSRDLTPYDRSEVLYSRA